MNVEVAVAAPRERVIFENLMQLYTHDFSELWYDRPTGEVDESGRFPDYALDAYWREPDHVPLLLRADSHIVGFALLNRLTHTNRAVDRNMAEFFVLRKHRRTGAGTAAAQAIFTRYPGMWEAAIARRNVVALGFWRRAIGEHPLSQHIEEVDLNTPAWNGPVLRFRIRAS
ncbi:MAG TPA: GNAT family N-acetyltransferase [Steroidobacteraceae bacterium]|nr:GNAT family N-acetyltransferase [Steroidobacteraceae bacterium]